MSPASGPVLDPKTFPAATMDDQEGIMEGSLGERTVIGPPPFSSPNPQTDAQRMLPLEDGTSAHRASLDAEAVRSQSDYKSKSHAELKQLVEERDLGEIQGTGSKGGVTKADLIAALQEDDASDMKASDFKQRIDAATNQEQLDEVAELYDNSGKTYTTVEAAFDAKQAELNENA